jgi:hypothetical protein
MPSDKSWIEQSEPGGQIFTDSYLHNECTYIRHWNSRYEWLEENDFEISSLGNIIPKKGSKWDLTFKEE